MIDVSLYLVSLLTMAGIYALLSLGLNLQWGYTGIMNAGVAGFFAIGAYASAFLTADAQAGTRAGLGLPWFAGLAAALVAAGLVGALVSKICVRLRTDYLAIATLGVAEIIRLVSKNEDWLTGGAQGISSVPRAFEGLAAPWDQIAFLGLVWTSVAAAYLLNEGALRSAWGRTHRAIRDNEVAAASIGKRAERFRTQSFVLGAGFMGVAGGFLAQYFKFIAPEATDPLIATFLVWVMVIAGGSGNNLGVVVGSVLIWTIWSMTNYVTQQLPTDWASTLPFVRLFLVGATLQAILVLKPDGLLPETTTHR